MPKSLLAGTNNAGKTREIIRMLADRGVRVITPRDLGLTDEPAEDGATFTENALIKARFFSRAAGLPCLADDSGLVVDALGGRPGVQSARYAPTDAERIARLLDEMRDVEHARRTARFVCAAALVDMELGVEVVETGTCEGFIAHEPRGENGFGYDPLFYLPDVDRTMAEISPEAKNARSHRGRALAAMASHFDKVFR